MAALGRLEYGQYQFRLNSETDYSIYTSDTSTHLIHKVYFLLKDQLIHQRFNLILPYIVIFTEDHSLIDCKGLKIINLM